MHREKWHDFQSDISSAETASIDRVILGTWGLGSSWSSSYGPMGYGAVSEKDAFDVFTAAWESGVRFVDVALVYGAGEALRRIAKWQRVTSHQFKPIVKVGRPVVDGVPVSRLEFESISREISMIAAFLGKPAAILIKDPPAEAFLNGRLSRLMGDIAATWPGVGIGVATHRFECAIFLPEAAGNIAQIEYNGLNWKTSLAVMATLHSRGWNLWGAQPLANGFLSGKYRIGHHFPRDDWRSQLPGPVTNDMIGRAVEFFDHLGKLSESHRPPVLATAFCLLAPHLEKVAVGPKHICQWRDVLAALALSRSNEFRELCGRLYRRAQEGVRLASANP
jgi:aryl-alcohol dehydrogenase-like predicted oxidoreductase